MTRAPIDFAAIAAAALASAESLLTEWLPDGKREGGEWKALNPTRADNKIGSFSVNLHSGAWSDFATGDRGGDLVALYAYLFTSGKQGNAARALAGILGLDRAEPETQHAGSPHESAPDGKVVPIASARAGWQPQLPVPSYAGPPPAAHLTRGRPPQAWPYFDHENRLLGLVCRFRTSDGGKEILPLVWARHTQSGKEGWRWMAFPTPRPLYGLDRLAGRERVLLTEGEKCADAGHQHLPELASLSWPGGCKAIDKVDWTPLRGKSVVIWPDCDAHKDKRTQALLPESEQPGMVAAERIAAKLLALGCIVGIVTIPAPGSKPDGWDIADAVADGMTGAELVEFIYGRLRAPTPEGRVAEKTAASAGAEHAESGLIKKRGELVPCLANVHDLLARSQEWSGVVAFDEFAQRTVKKKTPPYPGGVAGEWEATDDTKTAMWLQRRFEITASSALVAEAVEVYARNHAFHPVRDWLRSLSQWDGVERLGDWLTDCLGVPKSAYTQRVGRYFLMGMVARVMRPGVKFDYCLVLEGPQGRGKSMALSVLGGEWFGDTDLDLHNKDAMSALRGKWLYEFAELGSVTRAEASKQKSFLSRQIDEYRPVYGRREIRCPRQVVFAGSTNEWEWNKDPTGGRRFWPVDCCAEINIDALRGMREQLFAEALRAFDSGERFWPTPEEQRALFDPEQLKREQADSLVDALHDWVFDRVSAFSIADAIQTGLSLDASKLTRDLQTRVGLALRKLGCTKTERRNGSVRYWYEPPQKTAMSAGLTMRPAAEDELPPF